MKRKDTPTRYFVQRIPADVKPHTVGLTLQIPIGDSPVPVKLNGKSAAIRISLRTRNPSEAKVRQAAVAAYLEQVWQSLRAKPRTLTQKEAVALAGEVYRRFTGALEDDPGDAALWRRVQEDNRAAYDGRYGIAALMIGDDARKAAALEERFGPFADVVLGWNGIRIDDASRAKLLQQVGRAMGEATDKVVRNAEGDYRPDEYAARFPKWEDEPKSGQPAVAIAGTISGLLEGWSKEAAPAGKASVSTLKAYSASVRKLIAHLGHDDASKVTPENIVAFKNARLAEINPRNGKPVSAKTVNDGDLAALKTVFKWAVRNHKLASNPAAGITVAFAAAVKTRQKGFTDAEAVAILKHALAYKPAGTEYPKTTAAKRWVPWLCAYAGARVGEMVQLRKEDLHREGSTYVLRISPDAGTVKGRQFRDVPLHPHLVKLGFPAFVKTARAGYLFFTPTKRGGWRGPWAAVKNRVSEFVREVVSDPQVQPNHAWRHRFITLCREHGVDRELRRMITGHKGEGVDETSYGNPAGLYRELCKLPRYKVG